MNQPGQFLRKATASWLVAWMAFAPLGTASAAPTALADAPIFATKKVPPNLLLDLSVEWPTGVVAAYNDNTDATAGYECSGRTSGGSSATSGFGVCYFESRTYLGLFDPQKCYDYVGTAGTQKSAPPAPTASDGYFTPVAFGAGSYSHTCNKKFSGNFLNWATMQAVDTFRWALTGGDRVVDTGSKTILEKARHSGQGGYNQFPVKRIDKNSFTANGVTVPGVKVDDVAWMPSTTDTLYVRVHNGVSGFVDFYSGTTWVAPQIQIDKDTNWTGSNLRTYYLRVEVCKAGQLEANCELYGSSWKPTGLIQQNADRMRFGVFGYLLDSVKSRPGGVMRSKLKDVGPMTIDPINPSVANTRKEWSSTDGTLVANPDTADASASSVTQSGVINYLNKFGKASDLYKSTDTISEMYYESLRYLTNMGSATPEYVAGVSVAMRDGFPVITTWDDPVQYSCQKNYVMMIADVNAWCDYALPGTSITSHGGCPGHSASLTATSKPSGLNVTNQTNAVGKLDQSNTWASTGYTNLANVTANSTTGRGNTWYLAGLAYWANTNNLRPDKTKGTSNVVTAQTYMVDVAETGSWSVNNAESPARPINQMWLAAKYGGFANVNLDGIPANQATWDKNSDGVPDNYFLASRPDAMVKSLGDVFNSVLSLTESASGATLISSQVQNGDSIYEVQYSSDGWVGDVFGSTISFDAFGNPSTAPSWTARPLLDTMVGSGGWDTTRKIATWDGVNKQGVPFRLTNLTSAQQNALGGTATIQQEVLNWLRGDRSKEGKPYRIRKGILGDIVSAEAVPVAFPVAPYGEGTNPGYSAFKSTNVGRTRMVYAAANDGMLHAFAGATPGGGAERFAYVPSFGFSGPSVPATPGDNGLAALSQSTYQHRFYVDATPVVADVDFARVGIDPSLVPAASYDWRTILVGGLGKGGKGYYALDITNPTTMAASETALASKVLWEFTDADMGYTYGKPVITKLRAHGWVVIVTSGINNTDGTNKGKGYLYVLNAATGALIQKIGTGAGSATDPSGFTHISGYSVSFADATVDQVYGGDLLGNLWRFDLTSTTPGYPTPDKIATLTSDGTTPQPITTVPRIEQSLNGVTRWVFIGTGKLLDNTDMGNAQKQSMYAFKDGTLSTPATSATLPGGLSFPLVRTNFATLTDADLLTGITVGPTQIGWVHDLTGVGAALGTERVGFDPVANAGVVAWIGNIPSNDPCSPGVTSRSYAVNYETGKTTLVNIAGGSTLVPYTVDTYGLVKIQFIKVGDRVQLIASERSRKVVQVPSGSSGGSGPPRRINWREIID